MKRRWGLMSPAEFKAVERCLDALSEAWDTACMSRDQVQQERSASQMYAAAQNLVTVLSITTSPVGPPDLEAARAAGL